MKKVIKSKKSATRKIVAATLGESLPSSPEQTECMEMPKGSPTVIAKTTDGMSDGERNESLEWLNVLPEYVPQSGSFPSIPARKISSFLSLNA
jgi:hypothetical protein